MKDSRRAIGSAPRSEGAVNHASALGLGLASREYYEKLDRRREYLG